MHSYTEKVQSFNYLESEMTKVVWSKVYYSRHDNTSNEGLKRICLTNANYIWPCAVGA